MGRLFLCNESEEAKKAVHNRKGLIMIRGALAWAWMIVVGGLLLTPDGWICFRCGPENPGYIGDPVALFLGIGSLVLGSIGLVTTFRERNAVSLPESRINTSV